MTREEFMRRVAIAVRRFNRDNDLSGAIIAKPVRLRVAIHNVRIAARKAKHV